MTSTTLSASPNPVDPGRTLTLTATVNGNAPSGTLKFFDGSTLIGQVNLAGTTATLTTSFAASGTHTLSASYAGDVANTASTSPTVAETVNPRATTTTTLSASPKLATVGQRLTLTATVAGNMPTGTVSFLDGSTSLGSASLSSGTATLTTSFAASGTHNLTASYSGDVANAPSTSAVLSEAVLPVPAPSPALSTSFEYDANGNATKTVQAPGVTGLNLATAHTYDRLDRRSATQDAKGQGALFGYDGQDGLTAVQDPRTLVTTYARDGSGNAWSQSSPDTGTTGQTFDAAGQLKTRTDARGVKAAYSYDADRRLTGIVYTQGASSSSLAWTYDQTGTGFAYGMGRLTSTSFPTGSGQYAYDALGRLTAATQRVNATTGANAAMVTTQVNWQYDTAGHVTTLTYPSGAQASFTYSSGQLTAIGLAKNSTATVVPLLTQIQHRPFGPASGWLWTMSSGTQSYQRSYDSTGRLVRYPLGSLVRDVNYDAAGRLTGYTHYDSATSAAQAAWNQAFTYDELGRLSTAAWNGLMTTVTYDANGNRTGSSTTVSGSARTISIATTSNRVTGLTNPTTSLTYDQVGNAKTYGSSSYTWDLVGQLATSTAGTVTTTYSYDADGKRVRKYSSSGAGSTVIFVYGLNNELLGEYDSTGKAIREYVYLEGMPVAMFTPDPANSANPPIVFFIHADHINTPRVVVDRSNNVRWRWMNTDPWGAALPENNPSSLGVFTFNLRFPGQYWDQESGLVYNGARYLDLSTGRYISADPIGLAGATPGNYSLYPYANNAPTKFIDPTGLYGLPWEMPPGMVPVPQSSAPSEDCEKCKHTITVSTGGSCEPGDVTCAMSLRQAGFQGPYYHTYKTYDWPCLLKLGLGGKVGGAVVGNAVANQVPKVAQSMGVGARALGVIEGGVAVFTSPGATIGGLAFGVAVVAHECECTAGKH